MGTQDEGGGQASAPNGGYGWVVVACSFVVQMLSSASIMSLSVLYVSWLEEFKATKSETSLVVAVGMAFLYGIGPVAAFFTKKQGDRVVCVAGSLIAFVGFTVSSVASSVPMLIVCVGLVGGVGLGCCYLPSVTVVALYFDSKRALAYGFAITGVGIGILVQAPFLHFLEQTYGWRGAVLILAAILLHNAVCGLLMVPPPTRGGTDVDLEDATSNGTVKDANSMTEEETQDLLSPHSGSVQNCGEPFVISAIEEIDPIPADTDPRQRIDSIESSKEGHGEDVRIIHKRSSIDSSNKNQNSNGNINSNENISGNVSTHNNIINKFLDLERAQSPTKTSSVQHLSPTSPEPRQFSSAAELRPSFHGSRLSLKSNGTYSAGVPWRQVDILLSGSMHSLCAMNRGLDGSQRTLNSKVAYETDNVGCKDCNKQSIHNEDSWLRKHLRSVASFMEIMKDKVFLLLALCNFLSNLSFLMPLLYMMDRAREEGIDVSTGAIIVSMNGAGSVFGRLFFAFLATQPCFSVLTVYIGVVVMAGVSTCVSSACGSVVFLHGLYSFSYGAFMGGWSSLLPSLVVDLMGVNKIGQGFGTICLFSGIASSIGPPIAGWVYKRTGDFTAAFVLHGSVLAFSGAILLPFVWQRHCGKGGQREDSPTETIVKAN